MNDEEIFNSINVRYGYIGDVTKASERTMMLAILQGLGMVMMPLADFIGGQVYNAGPSDN